ncbi:hypothetical protein [Pseudomonas viridiflava]|uniref:hypothetical protein n=1 Tax=Pseudomonas viridiflava TaxID=33069 RepID=UPI000F05C229|nr:hypothetical protein [Pseudomonas viridiflava]
MALIEVINDANTVLVDDNYSNMCLALSSSLRLTNSGNTDGSGDGDMNSISYTAAANEYPQLVLELSGLRAAQIFTSKSGNTWTWYIAFRISDYGSTLNYHVMTIPSAVPNANGLLQLFDASGKLVFDSNLRYLKITGSYSPSQNSNINAGMDPAKKYGVLASSSGWSRMFQRSNPLEPAPPYSFIYSNASLIHRRVGTNIVSASVIHQQGNSRVDNPGSMNSQGTARILLLDITNF